MDDFSILISYMFCRLKNYWWNRYFLFSTIEHLSQTSNLKRIIMAGCQVIHPNKSGAPKSNHGAMVSAAKRNDYERVKILFKYGYRLEQKDNITDPLKKIELFKVSL